MFKKSGAALFIVLTLLYPPTLSSQQISADGSSVRFIETSMERCGTADVDSLG